MSALSAPTVPVTPFHCPRCLARQASVDSDGTGQRTRCGHCGWTGSVFLYQPVEAPLERPTDALPEDATCVHHPTKQATAVCEGTGDYICALCAIEVGGRTYSADYLNKHKPKGDEDDPFNRRLQRPERMIGLLFLLALFPYTAIAGPVFLIWSIVKYRTMLRMRRDNPLYRRLVGKTSIVLMPVILLMWTVLTLFYAWLIAMFVFDIAEVF